MPKQVEWGIYAWVHVPTGRTYVGQTGPTQGFEKRRNKHLHMFKVQEHHSPHLQRAWNKYGDAEFEFVVLENMTDGDPDCLTEREQFWMDNTNSEFNLAPIAGSLLGFKRSPENCARIGDAHRGMVHTAEARAKMSESLRGKTPWNVGIPHAPEAREKNRLAHLGNIASPETREKMSEAIRKSWENPERRIKASDALKGKSSWITGKQHSPETREKMSAAQKGRVFSSEHRENLKAAWVVRRANGNA